MPTVKRTKIARRLAIFAVLMVALVTVVSDESVGAIPCQANTRYYFSDSGCTNHVGTYYVTCNGYWSEGTVGPPGAPWFYVEWYECCGGGGDCCDHSFTPCAPA